MIKFLGQPIYDVASGKQYGYELFIREETNHELVMPVDFSQYGATEITQLLTKTVHHLPENIQMVAFNLDERQFIDHHFLQPLAKLQRQTPVKIYIELTEHLGTGDAPVTTRQLIDTAWRYQHSGLHVCLDDVGSGNNTIALVKSLLPYIVECKFALQNVRNQKTHDQIKTELHFWRALAAKHHIQFALEGIEKQSDLKWMLEFAPELVQGYYFGRPEKIPDANNSSVN